jgi:hypothetical protein
MCPVMLDQLRSRVWTHRRRTFVIVSLCEVLPAVFTDVFNGRVWVAAVSCRIGHDARSHCWTVEWCGAQRARGTFGAGVTAS